MEEALNIDLVRQAQDDHIAATVEREQSRLRQFIRRRVADPGEAEDILQEVFYEFTVAYRLMKPVEQAGAWLYRVARNRIIDRFRKSRPEEYLLDELVPSGDASPERAYSLRQLEQALERALDELPAEQRTVFLAHEVEGKTFREMAVEWGVNQNTLLARKHYAVKQLRERLREFKRGGSQ